MATGPLLFGLLTPNAVFRINTGVSLVMLAGAFALERRVRRGGAESPARETANPPVPFRSLVRLGWIIGGAGVFSISIIRVMWPHRGAELAVPKADIGLSLALLSYVQAGMGLALTRSKKWMRKILPNVLAGLAGTAALALYAFAPAEAWHFYLAAGLFGVYSGTFYFLLVYFALEDAEHAAWNVGINEFIVGITGITSPLFGGMLAASGAAGRAFYPEIALTLAVTIFTAIVLRRAAKHRPNDEKHSAI